MFCRPYFNDMPTVMSSLFLCYDYCYVVLVSMLWLLLCRPYLNVMTNALSSLFQCYDKCNVTAYRTDPFPIYTVCVYMISATLCQGRTSAQVAAQGTGNGLWIQNGTNPVTQSIQMPATEAEANKSLWTKGSCFPTMGK